MATHTDRVEVRDREVREVPTRVDAAPADTGTGWVVGLIVLVIVLAVAWFAFARYRPATTPSTSNTINNQSQPSQSTTPSSNSTNNTNPSTSSPSTDTTPSTSTTPPSTQQPSQ